jgi:hypothetical protein
MHSNWHIFIIIQGYKLNYSDDRVMVKLSLSIRFKENDHTMSVCLMLWWCVHLILCFLFFANDPGNETGKHQTSIRMGYNRYMTLDYNKFTITITID